MTDADLEDIGYTEVRLRFERGDYHSIEESQNVKRWLHKMDKEQAFTAACQRASKAAALEANRAARRANFIAFAALLVSVVSAYEQIRSIAVEILRFFGHR